MSAIMVSTASSGALTGFLLARQYKPSISLYGGITVLFGVLNFAVISQGNDITGPIMFILLSAPFTIGLICSAIMTHIYLID